jgi:hypothetical protein
MVVSILFHVILCLAKKREKGEKMNTASLILWGSSLKNPLDIPLNLGVPLTSFFYKSDVPIPSERS